MNWVPAGYPPATLEAMEHSVIITTWALAGAWRIT